MKKFTVCLTLFLLLCSSPLFADKRVPVKAVGIPLADHYAGIVAFEKYRSQMKFADYQLLILPGPHIVRAYFESMPDADMAFNVAPMIMDMFTQNQNFKWISLIHRDGNALAINALMNQKVHLSDDKLQRKPDAKVARAFKAFKEETGRQVHCAIPSKLATHTTILYKYFTEYNISFSMDLPETDKDVILIDIRPPKAPAFLKGMSTRNKPAAFEQSLPWAEITDTQGYGKVAWYSKDVMNHPNGHVECIIIAKDKAIKEKRAALKEVIYFIHKAGQDIETARKSDSNDMDKIIQMIQKHIPSHTRSAILESLRPDLNVINYKNLNINRESKNSFKEIMDLAFKAGFIKQKINIRKLADESFSTKVTVE